nr:helix-turn-helix transcriptional regulator [Angustibacter aerolatus]
MQAGRRGRDDGRQRPRPAAGHPRAWSSRASTSRSRPARSLAGRAHLSRFHFDRLVRAALGEPPGAFRRRLLLERSAHVLARGAGTVTDSAWAAGYGSPEAFSRAFARAFGVPPSGYRATGRRVYDLPAASGVHFHPPGGLRLPSTRRSTAMDLLQRMTDHHLWLVGEIVDRTARLDDAVLDRPIEPVGRGHRRATDAAQRHGAAGQPGWRCGCGPSTAARACRPRATPRPPGCARGWPRSSRRSASGWRRRRWTAAPTTPSWTRPATRRRPSPTAGCWRTC